MCISGAAFAAKPLEFARQNAAAAAKSAELVAQSANKAAEVASQAAKSAAAVVKSVGQDKRVEATRQAANTVAKALEANEAAKLATDEAEKAKGHSENAKKWSNVDKANESAYEAIGAANNAADEAEKAIKAQKEAEEALESTRKVAGYTTANNPTPSNNVTANGAAPPPAAIVQPTPPTPHAPVVIIFNKPIALYPPNLPLNCVPSPHLAVAQIAPGMKLTLKDSGDFDVDGVVLTNGQTVHLRLGFELVVEGGANCPLKSIHLVVEPVTLAANGGTAAGPNRSFALATEQGKATIKALPNPVLNSQLNSGCLKQALVGHSGPIIIDNSLPLTSCAAQTQSKLQVVRHISATTGA